MLGKLVRVVVLSGVLSGLCAPLHANTTMSGARVVALTAAPTGVMTSGEAQLVPDAASNFQPLPPARIVLLLP